MSFKFILISGVARSGKSITARSLHKELGYSYLSTDNLRFMIEKRLTDQLEEITPSSSRREVLWPHIESFVKTMLMFGSDNDGFILEGDAIEPESLTSIKDLENLKTVCVGYPNISFAEKFAQIRKFKTKYDWTGKLSDQELGVEVEKLIARSKDYQERCQKLGIKFIDISDFAAGSQELREYCLAK